MPRALATAGLLAAVSMSLAALITPVLTAVVLVYGLIQVGYWIRLKQDPLIDPFFTLLQTFCSERLQVLQPKAFGSRPGFFSS